MRWPTYTDGTPILAGDWVRVFVPVRGIWHHGIIRILYWVQNGIAVQIIHNDKSQGVCVVDWYGFADGNTVILHKRRCQHCARTVVARAEANLGKPYHVFAQNCEHFASFAFTGEATSESVRAIGAIAAIAFVVGYIAAD